MRSFEIGLSALRTHQQALATLGNNVANASTPGYHRQRVDLTSRAPSRTDRFHIGAGVEVSRITRMRNQAVETALLRNTTQSGFTSQNLDISQRIETLLTPGESSIHSSLSRFFNGLEKVSNTPQDLTVRREFITSAVELSNGFNDLDQSLSALAEDVRGELESGVDAVNELIRQVGSINDKIFQARSGGSEPNDLLDQRDQMISQLSEWIDVEQQVNTQGRELLVVGGGAAIAGQRTMELRLIQGAGGTLALAPVGIDTPMPIAAGKIKALLDAHNEVIPDTRERLGELAGQIIQAVDSQHAKGIPDTGAFRVLLGQRPVSDVTAPLSRADTAFPVTAGDMYVTITDSSGNRRTEKITVDPTIDSLDDLAARFDAVTGLSASVDGVRKTISFQSEAGYSFDFAGRTDNVPNLTAFSGTSQPQFSGIYSGSDNNAWTVSFSGPGTIGVTPGLTATVRDQAGNIITTKFVGEGYEAGTPLEVYQGLSMKFTNGTVVAGDEASLNVVANSDTTGLLSALGVNSLFSGASAGIYAVRQDIVNSPQSLSGSLNGNPGDATNFARIAKLRDSRFAGLGSRTFTEEMADITADSGLAVQAAENQNSQLSSARINMEADRDAVSGVDINEEMLRMMEVERAYQAATRFISAIDGTLDDLLQMSR